MPSSFSTWSNRDGGSQTSWNGDSDRAPEEHGAVSLPLQADGDGDGGVEELKDALEAARRRLKYFEGFAPWIEEQMVAVVERASAISAENEREQQRIVGEIERQRGDVEQLTQEAERLREEAKSVVAEANATAEDGIGQANATAARVLAQAQRNAETMVKRLRAEAAAIVTRALGDLTALETNAAADLAAAVPS